MRGRRESRPALNRLRRFLTNRDMNVKTPHAAASALFACLVLAPGCDSVDDPATPAQDGSSGEVDDPSTALATPPSTTRGGGS